MRVKLLLFLSFFTVSLHAAQENFLRGDLNQDGKVSVTDLVALEAIMSDTTSLVACNALQSADINADGVLNDEDIRSFIDFFFAGTSPQLPMPFHLPLCVETTDAFVFDTISEKTELYDPEGGSDLQYIHFTTAHLTLQPGATVNLDVVLRTVIPVQGVSFGLRYDPRFFSSVVPENGGADNVSDAPSERSGDQCWSVSCQGRLGITRLLTSLSPERFETPGTWQLESLVSLSLTVSDATVPGTRTHILFENMTAPAYSDGSNGIHNGYSAATWIYNETTDYQGSSHSLEGLSQPLVISIEEDPVFVRGEINADGAIDPSDAVFLLSYLFVAGNPPACPDAGDTNDDGSINIADVVLLLNYLFAQGISPSAPFPETDFDPSFDMLPPCEAQPLGLLQPNRYR